MQELDALKTALENATSKVVAKPMTADWNALSTAFDDLYTFFIFEFFGISVRTAPHAEMPTAFFPHGKP